MTTIASLITTREPREVCLLLKFEGVEVEVLLTDGLVSVTAFCMRQTRWTSLIGCRPPVFAAVVETSNILNARVCYGIGRKLTFPIPPLQ